MQQNLSGGCNDHGEAEDAFYRQRASDRIITALRCQKERKLMPRDLKERDAGDRSSCRATLAMKSPVVSGAAKSEFSWLLLIGTVQRNEDDEYPARPDWQDRSGCREWPGTVIARHRITLKKIRGQPERAMQDATR